MPTITGTSGNDVLTGGDDVDTLIGLEGDDVLSGGGGDDFLSGGSGRNRLDGGTGTNTVDYRWTPGGVSVSLATTAYQDTGYSTDQLVNITRLIGTSFADVLTGSDGNDYIDAGLTSISGAVHNQYRYLNNIDVIDGGAGSDTLVVNGISNGSVINGGAGNDVISAGFSGTTSIISTRLSYSAVDGIAIRLNGGDGNDRITALSHAVIDGGDGDDIITVGVGLYSVSSRVPGYATPTGTDTTVNLTGGRGSDTFIITNPVGEAVVTDFEVGIDRLDLSNYYYGIATDRIMVAQQGADTIYISASFGIYARLTGINAASIAPSTYLNNSSTPSSPSRVDTSILYQYGFESADTLQGAYVYGAGGDDVLSAISTGSTLNGAAGNDRLIGGFGPDNLIGGSGDDYVVGGVGADRLSGGDGFDTLDYSSATGNVTVSLAGGTASGAAGADYVDGFEIVIGSNFDDTLTGGSAAETLIGGSGRDTLTGGAGTDTFVFRPGDSTFSAPDAITDFQTGVDRIELNGITPTSVIFQLTSTGTTVTIAAAAQSDTVIAVTGLILPGDIYSGGQPVTVDRIIGQDAASDTLTGSAGDDTLLGQGGDDVLIGGLGADTLTGGSGRDAFTYRSVDQSTQARSDRITDFESGIDLIDMRSIAPTTVVLTRSGAETVLSASDGIGGLLSVRSSRDINGGDIVTGGSASGVTLRGDSGADVLIGGSGTDILIGGLGGDRLIGGAGADVFLYTAASESSSTLDIIEDFQTGIDRIDIAGLEATMVSIIEDGTYSIVSAQSSSGAFSVRVTGPVTLADITTRAPDRQISGTAGADDLVGASGNDTIAGSGGNDRLSGAGGADVLRGDDGDDQLLGGAGTDILTGGSGADTFTYLATSDSTAAGQDVITDFQTGSDRIDLTAINPSSVSVFRFDDGGSVVFAETPAGGLQILTPRGTPNGSDFVYSGAFGVYVIGSESVDTIAGSARPDPLVGNGGDDVITGGGGADAIAGGAGRDIFRYVSASDSNQASGFDNLYDFTTGEDRIDLSALNPTSISIIRSENGSSFVYAETASGSFLTTAAGRAINGTDFIYGPNGVGNFGVYMVGSSGGDFLTGSSLADPIAGGGGDDLIAGGGGADAMFGGAGADTFIYAAASDSTAAATDGIFDFVSGVDRLDLLRVRTGAADTFGIAYLDGASFLFVDLGGNGTNDMVIGLANTTLLARDVVWTAGAIANEPEIKDVGPQTLLGMDEANLFGDDAVSDLSLDGRFMLDLNPDVARGFHHGQDWYL